MNKTRNKIVIIVIVAIIVGLGGLFLYLNDKSTNLAAKESSASSGNSLTISIPDSVRDFPIRTTRISDTTIECVSGQNSNLEWTINQYKNEKSLCSDTDNLPFDNECSGSSWAKETTTERACYWAYGKKFHSVVNNNNFTGNGCLVNAGSNYNEPGGNSVQLMTDFSKRADWKPETKYFTLGNLEKLIVTVDYSTDVYTSYGSCPANQCDRLAGCDPLAFALVSVITSKFDRTNSNWLAAWKGTQFYSVTLYDTRESVRSATWDSIDCTLPTATVAGSFVNTSQNIAAYGLDNALPGGGTKHYEIDVLPNIKKYIQKCLGEANWNEYRVDGTFFTQEIYGKTLMSNTFTNPQVKFVLKDSVQPPVACTPSCAGKSCGDSNGCSGKCVVQSCGTGKTCNASAVCVSTPASNIADINLDGVVNGSDYTLFVTDYLKFRNIGTSSTRSDMNNDGKVDATDYNMFVKEYLKARN